MTMHDLIGEGWIAKGLYWSKSLTLVKGCNPVSEGCDHCWSARMASRFDQGNGFAKHGRWTGKIEPNEKALAWLQRRAERQSPDVKPQVFSIWNDLFYPSIPVEFIDTVLRLVWHTDDIWLILTKRPERLGEFAKHYSFLRAAETDRIWLGVTVELQNHIGRINELVEHWPGKKFVSIEPCLEAIDLSAYLGIDLSDGDEKWIPNRESVLSEQPRPIDFVIIGCESGPGRRPMKLEWAESIAQQCTAAGVPLFVKQLNINGRVSKDMSEWPEPLRRRELPE